MTIAALHLDEDIRELLQSLDENDLQDLALVLEGDEMANGTLLYALKYALYTRGKVGKDYIDGAIETAELLVDQFLGDDGMHPPLSRAALFHNTSCMLDTRFEHRGATADLESSVYYAESAVATVWHAQIGDISRFRDHLDRVSVKQMTLNKGLADEGKCQTPSQLLASKRLLLMFDRDLRAEDGELDEAIALGQGAVLETPSRHPFRVHNLIDLGRLFMQRFHQWTPSAFQDVANALSCFSEAVDLTVGMSDHVSCLREQADALLCISGLTIDEAKSIEYLDGAISSATEAIRLTPSGDPERAVYLHRLGAALRARFAKKASRETLDQAFEAINEAYLLCERGQEISVLCVIELATLYVRKYEWTSNAAHLTMGIDICDELLRENAHSNFLGDVMHILSQMLRLRSDTTSQSSMDDIERAVDLSRKAVAELEHLPASAPTLISRRANLAMILARRSKRLRRMKDVEEVHMIAIQVLSSTDNTVDSRAPMIAILIDLARIRYRVLGGVPNMDDLIQYAQDSLVGLSRERRNYFSPANNLARLITLRARLSKNADDVESAVAVLEPIVRSTPKEDAHYSQQFNNLGEILEIKFELSQLDEDRRRAISVLVESWDNQSAESSLRIESAQRAANLLMKTTLKSDWEAASELLEGAVKLLPFTSPNHLRHDDNEYNLSRFSGLVSLAMSAALRVGRRLEDVVEMVEHGRAVIVGNLLQARSDLSRIRELDKDLAERYEQVRDTLDAPGGIVDGVSRRAALVAERDSIIEQIRALGFKEFPLKAISATELLTAARYGPIIIVNASTISSDALVMRTNSDGNTHIIHVQLPELTRLDIQDTVNKLRGRTISCWEMYEILEWLWTSLVHPIFESLGLFKESSDAAGDAMPHVWWIPLGPLSSLPIHAAGDYFNNTISKTTMAYAFSSYTPSIRSLLYSRRGRTRNGIAGIMSDNTGVIDGCPGTDNALLVSVEQTVGGKPLPATRKEIDLLAARFRASGHPCTVLHGPDKATVAAALPTAQIFHFAGHGLSHSSDPLQSRLLLSGGMADSLTVGDLLELRVGEDQKSEPDVERKQPKPPLLAFLSACSTGTSKASKLLDENIHLMTAFRLAGYQHVIGSLWELSDDPCIEVASGVYDELLEGGKKNEIDDEGMCRALHQTVLQLRRGAFSSSSDDEGTGIERSKRELKKSLMQNSSWWALKGADPRFWAAYIHMGI